MKNTYALVIAITLGIAAVIFNYAYLTMKSQDFAKEEFIRLTREVAAGKRLSKEDLEAVAIPKGHVGNLKEVAVLWDKRTTVYDPPVWRRLEAGSLLLYDDLRSPAEVMDLGENEAAIGIPVDARSYPMALVEPGDQVSFVVPKWRINVAVPTPAAAQDTGGDGQDPGGMGPSDSQAGIAPEPERPAQSPVAGPTETIGPFTVLSLGNRLGRTEVMKANRIPQVQGNVMTIRVTVGKDYKLQDPKAQKLVDLLHASGFRQVSIVHFPKKRTSNR